MNNTIKELIERQSVRLFTDKDISRDDRNLIIEAAVNAPTAGNQQMYTIIDCTSQDVKERLAILCDNQKFIAEARMVLIFCADYQKWYDTFESLNLNPRHPDAGDLVLAINDALIAAQNSVTAAWSLGIGSCYIGDVMENCEDMIELLKLPQYVFPACMLIYGYPDYTHLNEKPQRVDNSYIVSENQYRHLNSDELKDMFKDRVYPKDYREYMDAFIQRKYNSDFSKEMSRSVNRYIDIFKKGS